MQIHKISLLPSSVQTDHLNWSEWSRKGKPRVCEPILSMGWQSTASSSRPGTSDDLFWAQQLVQWKKAQCIYFPSLLKDSAPSNFYKCMLESVLSGCIIARFCNSNAQERRLQKMVDNARSIKSITFLPLKHSTGNFASRHQPISKTPLWHLTDTTRKVV